MKTKKIEKTLHKEAEESKQSIQIQQNNICLKKDFSILHVIGPHAGFTEEDNFSAKINDIKETTMTFWYSRTFNSSSKILDEMAQKCKELNENLECIFIAPSQKGGAKDTITSTPASQYSYDLTNWEKIPEKMSNVSGKFNNKQNCALKFTEIKLVKESENKYVNLWDYAEYQLKESNQNYEGSVNKKKDENKTNKKNNINEPVIFRLGKTLACTYLQDTSNNEKKAKSNQRRVVAIATFDINHPYVWIKE